MVFEQIGGAVASYKTQVEGGIKKSSALNNSLISIGQSLGTIGKFTLAATAIGGIITAVQAYKKHQAEIIQQAQENAEAYNDEVESLQDYRSEVESLTKSIESGTLSSNELFEARSKLKEIQDDLAQTYGSDLLEKETVKMDLLTASTEQATAAFEGLAKEQASTYLTENKKNIETAIEKMYGNRNETLGHFNWQYMSDKEKQAVENIVALNDNLDLVRSNLNGTGQTMELVARGSAEEIESAVKTWDSAISDLENPLEESIKEMFKGGDIGQYDYADAVSAVLKSVGEIIDNYSDTATAGVDAYIVSSSERSKQLKELTSTEQAYTNAVSSSFDTEEERAATLRQTYDTMINAADKYAGVISAIEADAHSSAEDLAVADRFEETVKNIENNAQKLKLDIDMSDAINGKNMDDAAKAMMGGLGKSLEAFADGNGDIFASDILNFGLDKDSWDTNNLTDMQKAYLTLDAIAGHYNTTVDGLLNTAKEHNLVIGSTSQLLGDAQKAYSKYTSGVQAVNSVIDSQVAGQSISLETYESLIAISDKYADALENEGGVMQFNTEKLREITEARNADAIATINNNRKDSEKQYIKNAESIKKLRKELASLTAGEIDAKNEKKALIAALEAENKEVAQAIDKYNIMASTLAEMNTKRRAWLDAQNDPLSGAALGDASNALKHINDVLNKRNSGVFGDIGTTKYKTAIDFVIPEEISADGKKAINKYMNSLRKYLEFDGSGGLKGVNINNIVKKLTGGEDPFFGKNKDGSYFVREGKNLQDFADALNVTLEMAEAIIGMMNQKGWDLNLDPIDSMVDKYERATKASEKLFEANAWNIKVNFDDLDTTQEKLDGIEKSLDLAGAIAHKNKGTEIGGYAKDIIDYLIEQKKMLEQPVLMNIDTSTLTGDTKTAVDAFQELTNAQYEFQEAEYSGDESGMDRAVENMKSALEKIKDLPNIEDFGIKLDDLINLDDDSAILGAADKIKTALQGLEDGDWIKIGVPEDQIAGLKASLDGVTQDVRSVEIKVDGTGEVEAAIELIRNLKGKTVINRIITVYSTIGGSSPSGWVHNDRTGGVSEHIPGSGGSYTQANGTAHASGTAYASGDWRTKVGGRALMGELGEEILINPHTGRWRTVGTNGAEFVNVPKGSIIFNHLQTRHLLRNGYVTSRGKLNGKAYASGTAYASVGVSGGSGDWEPSSGSQSGSIPVTIVGDKTDKGNSSDGTTLDKILANVTLSDSNNPMGRIPQTIFGNNGEDQGGLFANKEAFESEYKIMKHRLELEEITREQYLEWLKNARADADAHGFLTLEELYETAEEVLENRKQLFEDFISDAEHHIETLGREVGKEADIINVYNEMIMSIEAQMSAARERGIDENSDYIQELQEKIWGFQDKIEELQDDATDGAKDAIKDLVDYRIDMLKQDLENERDVLNKKLDDLREFYDKQKEMLQETRDEEEYIEEQSEKRKAKTDILAEIDRLKRDNSAWAKKRVLELEEELAEAEKELTNFEKDNALDKAIGMLDDLYERQEQDIESQIESIEDMLNDPEALYNQALRDIQNNSVSLYEEMVKFNAKWGSGNPEDVKQMWDEAKESLDKYLTTFGEAYKDIVLVSSPSGYASGTRYATKGVHKVDELGPEYVFTSADGSRYRMFSGGEKVLNANATNFLYNFATSGGKLLSKIYEGVAKTAGEIGSLIARSNPPSISTGDVVVQGNADHATVSELRRLKRDEMQWILKEFNKMNRRS